MKIPRPLLEYATSVWDPYEVKHKEAIEKVQRRAARFVLNRYHNTSSVTAMIDHLGWAKLENRRKNCRLTAFYKIQNDIMICPHLKAQLKESATRNRRQGNDKQFQSITCKTNYRAESFMPRTIPEWNSLPQTVVDAPTLDTFTSRVSRLPQ